MTPSIGLYYPYTHFRDSQWLKLAALYWPGMARITPKHLKVVDDKVTRILADELGFIVDLPPDTALMATSRKMLGLLSGIPAVIEEHYRINGDDDHAIATSGGSAQQPLIGRQFVEVHDGASSTHIRWPGPQPSGLTPQSFTTLIGIHHDKMTVSLIDDLVDRGMALRHGEWLAVHPNIAWAYMSLLATTLADLNGLTPVTDEDSTYLQHDWTSERLAAFVVEGLIPPPAPPDPHPALGLLALRLVIPANLSAVPVEKIVAIRRQYVAEFDAFGSLVAQAVAELPEQLASTADPSVVEAYLSHEVSRRFDAPLKELRSILAGIGIDSAIGATSIKFELPVAAAAVAGGWAAGEPILAGAGAALGLVALRRAARRQRRQAVFDSPAGYLWSIERKLGTRSLLDRLLRRDVTCANR